MVAQSAKDWTVLLVDDTPDNLIVAEMALAYHGANVYTANNGHDAIAMLDQLRPTVILLDIRMPDMDGWTMFKLVRENPKHAHIPIIAITAYAMQGDRTRVLEMGFDGYISKPFDVTRLIGDIARILQESASTHGLE